MTHRTPSRAAVRLLAAALVMTPLLAACAGGGGVKKDTRYVARDVSTLYRAAQDRLDRGQYKLAAALFDEVERQHP
jgi:outer membrane protein assembly factor BamD